MMILKTPADPIEKTAIQDLLAIAREKFVADLHLDVCVFDQQAWDVRRMRDRSTTSANPTLYFTRHGTLDQPLPHVYSDIVKSWIILDRRSVGNMSRRVEAARILWEAIDRRRRAKTASFSWQSFSEEDLSQAELLMRGSWSASVLEETPHRLPIPSFHWARRMTSTDVARVLGVQKVPRALPRHIDEQGVYYRAFEVEAFLLSLRGSLWTVDRRNGTFQMLSETLLIAFRNFFHSDKAVFPLLVQPIRISQIADFLSGGGGTPSAFERFGIREPDGSFCRITSHQFRHWLNYIADKGGLSVDLQSRWMGREHSRDTEAYRHATVDERLEWVKDGIRDGKLAGPKASMYFELSSAMRNRYLQGELQAVHFTALGVCLHDFAITPCPYHLNCIRGCADYLRIKGSESERSHLIQIQQATEQALASAQACAATPDGSVAEPWIRHCEETLEGVRAALAVDDEMDSVEAGMAQPFHGRSSKFQKVSD